LRFRNCAVLSARKKSRSTSSYRSKPKIDILILKTRE
jgi:hypothetical protein